jgi:AF2212-like
MQESFRAVYRDGAFVPIVPCDLPNETPVEVVVQPRAGLSPPLESDPAKRAEIMRRLVERMSNSPLPADAPKFTREQLHERG